MDYYRSGERKQDQLTQRQRQRRFILIVGVIVFVLAAAGIYLRMTWDASGGHEPGKTETAGSSEGRDIEHAAPTAINRDSQDRPGIWTIFLTAVMRRSPTLYTLVIEKNGKDIRLRPGDTFEINYHDEFVLKQAITDALLSGRVTAVLEGMQAPIGMGTPVKGLSLADRAMAAESGPSHRKALPAFSFVVRYREEQIAQIPVRVIVTPQDWLRSAKNAPVGGEAQIESLKKAIGLNPNDLNVRRMLAWAYVKRGNTDQALREYRRILTQKPDDRLTMVEMSGVLMGSNNYDEALVLYKKILAGNPRDASALANAGLAASKTGKWREAADYYSNSLKADPGNTAVLFRLGEALEKTGKPDRAAEQYRAYLKRKPGDLEAMTALGDLYMNNRKYDEAMGIFSSMAHNNPKNATAYIQLGLAYGAKGKNREEIESYKKALQLTPGNDVVHYNLAVALSKAKRYNEASGEFEQVLKLKPEDGDSLLNLGELSVREKKYSKAISFYERALKLKKGQPAVNAAAHAGLGFVYGEMSQYRKSAVHYENALSLGAKDISIIRNLGAAYEKLGDAKKMIGAYERYTASNPDLEILTALAPEYLKQKNYDKAVKTYERMIKIRPKSADVYASLGWAYGLKGDTNKEIENYKTALKYDKEDDDTYYHLGSAYERKGLYSEALTAYTAAYEINPESKAARKIPQLKIKIMQQKYGKE